MFAGKDDGSDGGAAELQKAHYKTDWHRYNLKRKVSELPPVTAENFRERVLAQKEQVSEQVVDTSCSCRTCGKHFSCSNAFENHLKSKKHRDAAAREEKELPADVQRRNAKNKEPSNGQAMGEQKRMPATDTEQSMKLEKAGTTSSSHSARTAKAGSKPSVESATGGSLGVEEECADDSDAGSEESWSGEALGLEECLFCPHVSESLETNLKHMTVEHSFFIPDIEYLIDLEGLVTYLGQMVGELHMCLWCGEKSKVFTELKAVQQHMVDKGHCKLLHDGDATLEFADYYDYRKSYPDYKESDKDAETEAMEDDDEDNSDDEPAESGELAASGFQLVLPSGATVGHRSLMKYYRQKLRPDRQLVLAKNSSAVSKVISHYKALGWTGTTGAAALTKAKDIAYVRRLQAQQWTQVGIKANKLQRHFRDQVFGF
jgi:pre-60S factor REI1